MLIERTLSRGTKVWLTGLPVVLMADVAVAAEEEDWAVLESMHGVTPPDIRTPCGKSRYADNQGAK